MRLVIGIRGRPRRRRPDAVSMAAGALAGLLGGMVGTYFLDRRRGHARRAGLQARTTGQLRRGRRRVARGVHARTARVRGRALALVNGVHRTREEEIDDVTLAHRVESTIFRDPHMPKGQISINAESGAVFLRGQVESPELIDDLVHAVGAVRGVRHVQSLLHLPGTPAPSAPAGTLLRHESGSGV